MLQKRLCQNLLAVVLVLLVPYVFSSPFSHTFRKKHNSLVKGMINEKSVAEQERNEDDCFRDPQCELLIPRYRSNDGTCNNLNNPLFGASEIPFIRYLPSAYEDGVGVPRGEGRTLPFPLPTPRQVSVAMSNAPRPPNFSIISLMVMQWGQFLDHDMVFTPEFEDMICCEDGIVVANLPPECRPLDVVDDVFYSQFGVECLDFVRSLAAHSSCVSGSREQINELTSYIDGSQVYGSTTEEQLLLRSFEDGRMVIGPGEEIISGACPLVCPLTFLPSAPNAAGDLVFMAGDRRAQEQAGLTSMHTLFVRAHNDLATQLRIKYPNADDESLFQETRRIIGALIQQISYGEFLPLILGSSVVNELGLLPLPPNFNGYSGGYRVDIDASAPNVFATAAFRFGHSLISDIFVLRTQLIQLVEAFNNHNITLTFGSYPSDFLEGISFAQAEGMDQFLVETLTNKLFAAGPSFSQGTDLYSLNIMRGRDHGLPSYNEWRSFCGLSTFSSFNQLADVMPTATAEAFENIYGSVDDIDIFPAGIAEFTPNPGDGILGPTFSCIIGYQFYNLKFGDRYYYEGDAQPEPFTLAQLRAIRSTTLASLICAYTDTLEIQRYAMIIPVSGNLEENCFSIIQGTIPDLILNVF